MPRKNKKASSKTAVLREVASPDGKIVFAFKRTQVGVHVVRRQELQEGSRIAHSSLFVTGEEFARFCDEDPLRFDHAHTYMQAKRTCHDLFQLDS